MRILAALLMISACAVGSAQAIGGAPLQWGGSTSVGHNSNILGSSYAERAAFGRHDPQYLFLIDRLEDWQVDAGLWARWDVPGFFARRPIRTEVAYDRRQIAHNPILGLDTWSVDLRQRLRNKQRYFDLALLYQPQVYLRHRNDTAALPGEPVFRPEAYRDTEAKLLYNHTFGSFGAGAFSSIETRRENRWFRWRNETRSAAGGYLQAPSMVGIDLIPSFEYGSSRAPGDALNLSDRSYHEGIAGILARWAGQLPGRFPRGSWSVQAGTRWKFRRYTASDPLDAGHFHRRDRLYSWSLRIARPTGFVTPFVSAEGSGRRVFLPAGATASPDEAQYATSIVRAGVEWQINRE